jgi:hypothetical protein
MYYFNRRETLAEPSLYFWLKPNRNLFLKWAKAHSYMHFWFYWFCVNVIIPLRYKSFIRRLNGFQVSTFFNGKQKSDAMELSIKPQMLYSKLLQNCGYEGRIFFIY